MRRDVGAAILLLVGASAIRFAWTGEYLYYLKSSMRWPLGASGLIIVALAIPMFVSALREGREVTTDHGADHEHGEHGEHGGPRIAWLLLLPALVVLLIAPAPLRADAVQDRAARSLPPVVSAGFGTLSPADGPVQMTLREFSSRATWDRERSLTGIPVLMTGFVVVDPAAPDGFMLTRFAISCCAADALGIQVATYYPAGTLPAEDTWVQITGSWVEAPPGTVGIERGTPTVEIDALVEIDQPANPYE